MPLPSTYRGGTIPTPVRLRPSSDPAGFAGDNNIRVVCQPSQIITKTFTAPSTIDPDGISVSHAGASVAGTTNMTIGGALASGGVATLTPARNVVITVTHATAVVAMTGTITGKRHGRTITEDWSVTAGGTSKTFTGKIAFEKITAITETVGGNASANSIIAGDGKVLGLDFKCSSVVFVAEEQDGTAPTPGILTKANAAAGNDPRGTYTPNATLNGALTFQVWYLSDDLASLF